MKSRADNLLKCVVLTAARGCGSFVGLFTLRSLGSRNLVVDGGVTGETFTLGTEVGVAKYVAVVSERGGDGFGINDGDGCLAGCNVFDTIGVVGGSDTFDESRSVKKDVAMDGTDGVEGESGGVS